MRRSALLALLLCSACFTLDKDASFEPVDLPILSGEEGFSYRIPEFEVASGEELQDCYFVTVPGSGTDPVWIDRIHAGLNPGSHHFNVFRVNTIKSLDGAPGTMVHNGECFKSANWSDWPLVFNTQRSSTNDPYFDWRLPDGVAHRFTPGEKLMLQVHYVNASSQQTPFKGKAAINFHRSATSSPTELGTLFATQQSIQICQSNPSPSYSGACSFPADQGYTIVAANGHFHSRGKQLDMFQWDGTSIVPGDRFYRSTSWDDPPMTTGLNVTPPTGGGVWWTCDYQWQEPATGCDALNASDPNGTNDCCYYFGPKVETSEHCNVFVYYYPKALPGDIFCN